MIVTLELFKFWPYFFSFFSLFVFICSNRHCRLQLRYTVTSNTVLRDHSNRRSKLVFKVEYRLMQVESFAECSKGSILQYFRPSLSYRLALRSLFCLFLSGCLRHFYCTPLIILKSKLFLSHSFRKIFFYKICLALVYST